MSAVPDFETFDMSVLGADSHLWLSVQSRQGSVFGVSRSFPTLSVPEPYTSPVEWLTAVVREARTDADPVAREIGRVLTELVFGIPDVVALLQQARGVAAARGAQVLVRLLLAPEQISSWPWELMIDPQQPDRFLALARDVQLVRSGRSRTYAARQAPIAPPLNLLLVMSSPVPNPGDTDAPFDLYEEKRNLLAELQPLVDRGLLRVEVEDRPSVERLRRRMAAQRRGFHLFHYLGHAQPAGLRLEERYGRSRLVTGEQISQLLQQLPDLRLAVFAGCETARAPAADPEVDRWPGQLSTVDHCVRDASPMVIGMQAVLPFSTERVFTRFLYSAITGGQPVAEALRLARLAVIDDEVSGGRLLNWAVPCLFVAGAEPGPLVDPRAKAVVPGRTRRVALKIGVRQSELRFVSRLNALRVSVDALRGRNDARLLMVLGRTGTGKSRLLDRTLEELDTDAVQLFVSARYLLAEADPVRSLCALVARVLAETGQRVPAQGKLTAIRWWERLLEDATRIPLALVVDDGDPLQSADPKAQALVEALVTLTRRRGRARLAVAATQEITALMGPLRMREITTVWLQPLDWPDVWQWIRRNLPVLTRYEERTLSSYYSDLPHLEQWEQLAEILGARQTATDTEFADIVVRISDVTVDAGAQASATLPPVFGGEPTATPPAAAPVRQGTIKVAIVGPFTQGREAQFARLLTLYAANHGVAGRTAGSGTADGAALAAELLAVKSPLDAAGTAPTEAIVRWLHEVRAAGADIILLDIGMPRSARAMTEAVDALAADGRLVIASGGNKRKPSYPAWSPDVLAVGALGPDGRPAPYSAYFARERKPELFAPETVADSPLAGTVADSSMRGTSFSALYAVAAAIVVWVTDRDRTASDIKAILIESATPIDGPSANGPRRLDTQEALTRTRETLLLDALERGPLELHELLAKTGMRPEHAVPLLDRLVADEKLHRVLSPQAARYENPESIHHRYVRMRNTPPGPERTNELELLVRRARELAARGRYRADDVVAMWDSGHDGRRILALAITEERPELGSVPVVTAGIRCGRSAFEVYHALVAAKALVPHLSADQLAEVREAIKELRSGDGAPRRSDRWHMSDQVLRLIAGRLTPLPDPAR